MSIMACIVPFILTMHIMWRKAVVFSCVLTASQGQRGFLATRGSASRVTRAVTPSSTEEDSDTNSETEEDQFHPPPTEKPPPPPQNAAPPPPQVCVVCDVFHMK